MSKLQIIKIEETEISILSKNFEDYISLTDMIKDIEGGTSIIENWLRNKNTIEFLSVWEKLNNPSFNSLEFEGIKNEAGLNRFHLSAKKWIEKTNAIGIISKSGRYGGTYAHKDIAFEFGSWISPMFKLLLIKEYQRLKEVENNQYNLEWDVKRILTEVNHTIHTDAVQKHIIPKSSLPLSKQGIEYANEVDLLNLALYGYTAKDWRESNPELHSQGKNMRDFSSINELLVMSNLEVMNAEMIKLNTPKETRFVILKKMVKEQLEQLAKVDLIKSVRKQSKTTYIEAKDKTGEEIESESKKSILEVSKQNLLEFKKRKGIN
ncbi:DNA-binding protein [Flavobacterium davisii]|uniref:DNA-binding protein n=1 Tax=Flavobacterium davisii TaxID=2906077 RepID=A0A246GID9_9FLAO|nr:KilA-N domain-containing protein [Flavobacterium davisii]OWP84027.1 DNA-binding protein [Flavobacterium davisii]